MPRSPSTVRLTGRGRDHVAGQLPACSGSTSTTECTSVVAPPTSTTTTSPTTRARQLDAGEDDVGGGAADHAREVSALGQVLATDHVGEEDLADRGPRRAGRQHADLRDDVVGEHVRDVGQDGGHLVAGLDVAGHHDRAAPPRLDQAAGGVRRSPRGCRRRSRRSAAPDRASRWLRCERSEPRSPARPAASTSTTLPPLDSATRRPASAVTSSSLPTTAIRSPPPALEQASTCAVVARGSASASTARQASYPSRTSVSRVVAVLGPGDDRAVDEVDQERLGERRAEVDADRELSQARGPGRRSGPRPSRCRR